MQNQESEDYGSTGHTEKSDKCAEKLSPNVGTNSDMEVADDDNSRVTTKLRKRKATSLDNSKAKNDKITSVKVTWKKVISIWKKFQRQSSASC